MANPLRVEENYQEIRDNRKKAIAKPSEREEYLTKNMNFFVPSNSGESYIEIDKLRLCQNVRGTFDWNGKEVYLGLDLAMSNDNTSVSMVTLEDDVIFATYNNLFPSGKGKEHTNDIVMSF